MGTDNDEPPCVPLTIHNIPVLCVSVWHTRAPSYKVVFFISLFVLFLVSFGNPKIQTLHHAMHVECTATIYDMTTASTIVYFWLNLCSPDPFFHRFSLSHWHNVGSLSIYLLHLRCLVLVLYANVAGIRSFTFAPFQLKTWNICLFLRFLFGTGATDAVSSSFPFGTWNMKQLHRSRL